MTDFKRLYKPKTIKYMTTSISGFPGGSVVKNPPAKWEAWVRSLGGEEPLEKRMASHSSILAWKILWTEETGGLQSMGSQRSMTYD